jgi:hypothetical protein
MTRILLVLALALALAPAALADGYAPLATQNGEGVLTPDGTTRFVAAGLYNSTNTMLTRIDAHTGVVEQSTPLDGAWGIPIYSYGPNSGEGLSTDGKTLVVADLAATLPRTKSRFLFVDPKTLAPRTEAVLAGDFSYDALSPDGTKLYLIQHQNVLDQIHYVVREYDVASERLLPGRVADRAQKTWVMAGFPVSRATSPDGRWVYTLYAHPNGFPFVHVLDTAHGVAHCVGLPWRGGANAAYNMRLTLHGSSLAVHWLSGKPWYRMDTRTWRLSPDHSGFPWWTLAFLALVPMIGVGAVLAHHPARRRAQGGDARGRVRPGQARPRSRDGLAAAAEQRAG